MHIEEELLHKALLLCIFMQMEMVSLFKKVSLAPPLVALWSVFPACSMHDEQRQTGLVIGFYTDLYERGK